MPDKKRVLVADDMEQNRKSIKTFLYFLHFDITLANNGLEAKNLLEANGYDLVVSDIEMPTMNGFELLSFIKRSSAHKDTPVIMLSSLEAPEVRERCMRLGASSYIVKPFTKDKFETALGALNMLPAVGAGRIE